MFSPWDDKGAHLHQQKGDQKPPNCKSRVGSQVHILDVQ